MRKTRIGLFIIILLLQTSIVCGQAVSKQFERGEGKIVFTGYEPLKDKPITLHYYIPTKGDIKKMRVLFSMHGAERSGSLQRALWQPFAERDGFVVIAPEFSKKYYKENDYQFGGVYEAPDNAVLKPREEWTYQAIEAIFDFFKEQTKSKSKVYDMFGHSAGSQFVHRYVLTMPHARVGRAIAANAGSWTFPYADGIVDAKGVAHGWPYSVKDTPMASDESLKQFLDKKLIIQIGVADSVKMGKNVPTNPAAIAQGEVRYERAWNFYNASKALAKEKGYKFNWKIVPVDGVGHASIGMIHGMWKDGYVTRDDIGVFSIDDMTDVGAYHILFKK